MNLRFPRLIALLVLLCYCVVLVSCQADRLPQGQMVKVSRVVSGQTIEVLDTSGKTQFTQRVRLLGIVAPHWKHQTAWSTAAKEQLKTLIEPGQIVRLESDLQPYTESDGTQLRLSYLWLDRQLLNETLVAGGYVLAQSRSPNHKYEQRLAHAQERARLMGLGIWNPQNPMKQDPGEFEGR